MSLFAWLKRKPETIGGGMLKASFETGGISYFAEGIQIPAYEWLQDPGLFKYWEPVALLGQLESEGFAVVIENSVLISWSDL
jgi:hypothetical protein